MGKVYKGSGVYVVYNKVNGKVYVGSGVIVERRLCDHLRQLRGNYHGNTYLQNSWNKYGENQFEFLVIEECKEAECISREQVWIDYYVSYKFKYGYNRSPTAGSCLGFQHSPATKSKFAKRMLGVPMLAEVRKKISAALSGKAKSASHRENLWKNRRGWKQPESSKQKTSSTLRKRLDAGEIKTGPPEGWKHSEATKAKMSAARRGKKFTPEHKANLSAAIKATLARKKNV